MKLIKKRDLTATETASVSSGVLGSTVDRRAFLRRAGLGLGGTAVAATLPTTMIRRANAERIDPGVKTEIHKSVCTHCSVGCGVVAEVQNGVWTGQEPDFDSPFNLGGHCAKGASVREHGHGERRLKYPMKLTGGKWTRVSWDQAIDEIGDKVLDIRKRSGPDSVYWLGSAKFNNEQAYLFRKFAALWGTNNVDHQARICHSTTVAGVANTWGYGAMTNSYNDMHNCKAMFFIGSNAAEAHPVAMQHVLRGKENGAKMIVVDPRFTRTAAHADQFVRIRPGTDVPLIWGILWHVFENGWEDKEYIRQRVYGMDEIRAEVAKWPPDVVENVTGVPGDEVKAAAQTMAENRPGTIVWCMGGTQHTIGNNNTRAYCAMQLALGNIGVVRRRRQHLPRPRQRSGRHGPGHPLAHAARLLRPVGWCVEALVGRMGPRLRVGDVPLRYRLRRHGSRRRGRPGTGTVREPDELGRHAGFPLDRRRARRQPPDRPA